MRLRVLKAAPSFPTPFSALATTAGNSTYVYNIINIIWAEAVTAIKPSLCIKPWRNHNDTLHAQYFICARFHSEIDFSIRTHASKKKFSVLRPRNQSLTISAEWPFIPSMQGFNMHLRTFRQQNIIITSCLGQSLQGQWVFLLFQTCKAFAIFCIVLKHNNSQLIY